MKRNKLPIILLIILISFNLQAQVFETLHSDNYLKVLEDTSKNSTINPYSYSDNTSDSFHLLYKLNGGDTTYSLLVDEYLNIIEKKPLNDMIFPQVFLFNNKIYNFRGGVEGTYPATSLTFFTLKSYDSIGNIISTDTIMKNTDDTIKWASMDYRILLLEDKNFILIFRGLKYSDNPDSPES